MVCSASVVSALQSHSICVAAPVFARLQNTRLHLCWLRSLLYCTLNLIMLLLLVLAAAEPLGDTAAPHHPSSHCSLPTCHFASCNMLHLQGQARHV
jgi:hypothetical protein